MNHVAIDLGGRESQICVRGSDGTVLEERRCPTRALGGLLAAMPQSRIVVETCAEAFGVADAALELGHEVRVVPASLVKTLGVGARGVKNDRSDARVLSEVSCRIDLPSVHVPSPAARERKTLCGMREGLVGCATKLAHTVRGWLRARATHVRPGGVETFPARVRKAVPERPAHVERQLCAIEALTQQIAQADREIKALARQDAVCQRLMTVPGVGPVISVRFVAALDEVGRFASAHEVESYLGLVPGERSSGERKRMSSITKAGSAKMRWALVQASWVARRWRPHDPMVQWALEVERRRGRRIAVVALARKLAGILYAIWRDGSRYDPRRGAVPGTRARPEPAVAPGVMPPAHVVPPARA
jgi:transposase